MPDLRQMLSPFSLWSGQLASNWRGPSGQMRHLGLFNACEYNGNSLPGVSFSVAAQLYSRVRGIYRKGTVAGASPN